MEQGPQWDRFQEMMSTYEATTEEAAAYMLSKKRPTEEAERANSNNPTTPKSKEQGSGFALQVKPRRQPRGDELVAISLFAGHVRDCSTCSVPGETSQDDRRHCLAGSVFANNLMEYLTCTHGRLISLFDGAEVECYFERPIVLKVLNAVERPGPVQIKFKAIDRSLKAYGKQNPNDELSDQSRESRPPNVGQWFTSLSDACRNTYNYLHPTLTNQRRISIPTQWGRSPDHPVGLSPNYDIKRNPTRDSSGLVSPPRKQDTNDVLDTFQEVQVYSGLRNIWIPTTVMLDACSFGPCGNFVSPHFLREMGFQNVVEGDTVQLKFQAIGKGRVQAHLQYREAFKIQDRRGFDLLLGRHWIENQWNECTFYTLKGGPKKKVQTAAELSELQRREDERRRLSENRTDDELRRREEALTRLETPHNAEQASRNRPGTGGSTMR